MQEESENNGGENSSINAAVTRPESTGRQPSSQEDSNNDSALTRADFDTRRMVSMVRERTMDSQDFYKRVNCLPLKIKQMTFISEEYESGNNTMNVDMHRHTRANNVGKTDYWNKDIIRQVDSWMKSRPIYDRHNVSPRIQFTPPHSHENLRKRRQKRHRLRGSDDVQTESAESINGITDSIVSVSSDKSTVPRSLNFESTSTSSRQFPNQLYKHKYGKYSRSTENLTDIHEKEKVKNSYGSAYNEIEFQKRYKRVNDLKSHLQFVNTTCLSGQNILKKTHRLPPMESHYDLDGDSTLAISSVHKHNEPDPQQFDQQSTDSVVSSVYATSTLVTTHISPFQERGNTNTQDTTPWVFVNNKPDVKHPEKIPNNKPKSPRTLKLPSIHSTRKIMRKKMDPRNSLSVSEYQVISETDIPGIRTGANSRVHGRNSERSPRNLNLQTECNNSEDEDDDDDQPDFGLREMKISIHIKYKKNRKNEPEVPWYAKQADGRIRTEYLNNNEETKTISKEMKHVSE